MFYSRAGHILVLTKHLLNEGMNMYKIKYLKEGCGWWTSHEFPGACSLGPILTFPIFPLPRVSSGDPCAHSVEHGLRTTDGKGEAMGGWVYFWATLMSPCKIRIWIIFSFFQWTLEHPCVSESPMTLKKHGFRPSLGHWLNVGLQ